MQMQTVHLDRTCEPPADSQDTSHQSAEIRGGAFKGQQMSDIPSDQSASILFTNFVYFSLFYSITHATVDAVLAFSTAELGSTIGSWAGFVLYIFYTISAFLFAKPLLNTLGPKRCVLIGLAGFLSYVGSFFLAILYPPSALPVFIIGAAIGGTGAGILWTAQGSYYALNAELYAALERKDKVEVTTNFAAIFAASYLGFEASFKLIATGIYVAEINSPNSSWRVVVFGLYTGAALLSVCAFHFTTLSLEPTDHSRTALISSEAVNSSHGILASEAGQSTNNGDSRSIANPLNNAGPESSTESSLSINSIGADKESSTTLNHSKVVWRWDDIRDDSVAVWLALSRSAALRYLIPYQLCFGFAASFVNTYINAVVVAGQQGDGYIGFLAGIATMTAVVLAAPYAYFSNSTKSGKWYIMVFGGCCFTYAGLAALLLSVEQLGSWQSLVPFFIIHGAARGVWENTNKSIIADFFTDVRLRDSAYAAVYCSSGLSGALGFLMFKFMNGTSIAILNVLIAVIATISFHYSTICIKVKVEETQVQ